MRASLVAFVLAIVTPITAAGQLTDSFPPALVGAWADSLSTCRIGEGAASDGRREWFRIRRTDIVGSLKGDFVRRVSARHAEATDASAPNILNEFELGRDGKLIVTVVGARASGSYVFCGH